MCQGNRRLVLWGRSASASHRSAVYLGAAALLAVLLVACAPTLATPRPTPGTPGGAQSDPHQACRNNDAFITIPDARLGRAVNQALNPGLTVEDTPNTQVRCSAMARVTTLTGSNVESLEGLQYAINLSEIRLRSSPVRSLAPLAGLPRLNVLNIVGGRLTSLHSLPRLPTVTALDISGNLVKDLSPLAALPALSYLNAKDNAIGNISTLAQLTELQFVDLSDNLISDVSALAGHSKLFTLVLNDNHVDDAGPLASLVGLDRLELSNNLLTDTDFAAGLALRTLRLAGNYISSVGGLAQNPHIRDFRTLDLSNNCISLDPEDPFSLVVQELANLRLEPQRDDCRLLAPST